MHAVRDYYARVLRRAVCDSWRFGRGHIVFALLLLLSGAAVGLLLDEGSLVTVVLLPLAVLGGACLLLLSGEVLLAPVRLFHERAPADDPRQGKLAAIQALDLRRREGQRILDELTGATPATSVQRRLARQAATSVRAAAALRVLAPSDPVRGWIDQTLRVLREHTLGQEGRFISDAGLLRGDSHDHERINILQRRMQRLDEIINALHLSGAEGLIRG